MKTTRRCPKCNGTRIGVLEGVYDDWSIELPADLLASFGIQHGPKDEPAPASYREPARVSAPAPKATTKSELSRTAYICAACGYYETYLSHPEMLESLGAKGGLWWLS